MGNRDNSIVLKKSFDFGVKIVQLHEQLAQGKHFVLGKQLLRSGTSIGANINEALAGYSKKEFVFKLTISLKEAQESEYWIKLIQAAGITQEIDYKPYLNDVVELQRILTAIIKTTRKNELN